MFRLLRFFISLGMGFIIGLSQAYAVDPIKCLLDLQLENFYCLINEKIKPKFEKKPCPNCHCSRLIRPLAVGTKLLKSISLMAPRTTRLPNQLNAEFIKKDKS